MDRLNPVTKNEFVTNAQASSSHSGTSGPLRVSQRQPLSCTECTRRKTKCDRSIPCANCRKRGVADRCHVIQIIPSKSLRTVTEVQTLRQESKLAQSRLEKRIAQLEKIIQTSLGSSIEGDMHISSPDISNISPGVATNEGSRQSAETEEESRSSQSRQDEEAVAAATLEFLALGRVRAKSPGGREETAGDGFWPPLEEEGGEWGMDVVATFGPDTPEQSPVARYSARVPKPTPSESSPKVTKGTVEIGLAGYKAAVRREIISRLPDAAVGRTLVKYDIETASWLNCCYHGPTLLSETDLFWSELGSEDVEVNWSFLALLFGVMMHALCHMPSAIAKTILPDQETRQLLECWFEGCLMSLHEANWMSSHSLYAVQCIAVLISPANHLGRSDLYFTMLGAAIKVAQALNLHRLGSGFRTEEYLTTGPSCIAREVRRRTWGQLIIQDWFHLGFNNTCSIQSNQFDTPSPLHSDDRPNGVIEVSMDRPSVVSHTVHLLKLASMVNQVYSHASSSGDVPYAVILRMDGQVQDILAQAPWWMRSEESPVQSTWPPWVEWQRRVFMVSAAHKVILLHRPYLGRAFHGDVKYARSREACLTKARLILDIFHNCTLEMFRKTWTVLAHTLAACIILLLEAAQRRDEVDVYLQLIAPVQSAVPIFIGLSQMSDIAKKGSTVLTSLLDQRPSKQKTGREGAFDRELDRAVRVFHREQTPVNNTGHRTLSDQAASLPAVMGQSTLSQEDVDLIWAEFFPNTTTATMGEGDGGFDLGGFNSDLGSFFHNEQF